MATALALALSLLAVIYEQSQILTITSSSGERPIVSFSSMKWKPVDGRSLIVESVQNDVSNGDLVFTYPSNSSGTALRASPRADGIVHPGRVTTSWATYRIVKNVNVGPRYFFSNDLGRFSQNSGQCWEAKGEATGKAGQSLDASLWRDDREVFSCRSTIEADKDGQLVLRYSIRNSSAKDATFEWGPYKETIKAGKSQEYNVKSAVAPKEADRHCTVTFTNDPIFVFRANIWIAP